MNDPVFKLLNVTSGPDEASNNLTTLLSSENATVSPPRDPNVEVAMGALLMPIGALSVTVNLLYILLVVINRRGFNWNSGLLYLNLSISDLLTSALIIVVGALDLDIGLNLSPWTAKPMGVLVLQDVVMTAAVLFTACCYLNLFLIQLVAIRHPIKYRTTCGFRRRIWTICSMWAAVVTYVIAKSLIFPLCHHHYPRRISRCSLVFSAIELTMFGVITGICFLCYVTVIRIARQQQKERQKRLEQANNSKYRFNGDFVLPERKKPGWKSFAHNYSGVTTAGIHLTIFFLTFEPFYAYWSYRNALDKEVYNCQNSFCAILYIVWFVRGVLDPSVQIWRNLTTGVFTGANARKISTTQPLVTNRKHSDTISTIA